MPILENTGFKSFCWLSSFYGVSILDISRTLTPKPINHFLKKFKQIFQVHLNIAQSVTIFFAVTSRICKKWSISDIFMTITLGVNRIIRQMTPFFSSTFWAKSVAQFHCCISLSSRFSSIGSPSAWFLVCKIQIYIPKMKLWSLLTLVSFFYRTLLNLVYNMFRSKFDTNMAPI